MESKVDIKRSYQMIKDAYGRISPHILKTPLLHSLSISKNTECNVYLKLESEQKTGSFKVRGAFNKLLTCIENKVETPGYVTASTGNHGMASALAFTTLNQNGMVFVPENVSDTKEQTLKLFDVKLEKFGTDCVETETKARKYAEDNGLVFISPYADMDVLYGQGTIALEILEDLPNLDVVFVTVGGGGLISGIASFLKAHNNSIKVIGCLPENSPVMYESVKAGKIIEMQSKDTLSDASAGGIEYGSPTFPICEALVDSWVTVTEEEIADSIFEILDKHHKVIEGSAGVALAAFIKSSQKYKNKNVAIVICGANISMASLNTIIKDKI